MASIFSKIINREIPAHIISETENCIAFLDVFPLQYGHTLVVPKKEVDYIFDLEDNLLSELTKFSKTVALAVKKAFPCERIGTSVIGLEVPHAHIHLIPINTMNDMNFANNKLTLSNVELAQIASKIISNL